jgi:hypothetical protein
VIVEVDAVCKKCGYRTAFAYSGQIWVTPQCGCKKPIMPQSISTMSLIVFRVARLRQKDQSDAK